MKQQRPVFSVAVKVCCVSSLKVRSVKGRSFALLSSCPFGWRTDASSSFRAEQLGLPSREAGGVGAPAPALIWPPGKLFRINISVRCGEIIAAVEAFAGFFPAGSVAVGAMRTKARTQSAISHLALHSLLLFVVPCLPPPLPPLPMLTGELILR